MSIQYGYTSNIKFWDRDGRLTPNVDWSESRRPNLGERTVAQWLPVALGRYNKDIEAYKVISAGKVCALDKDGKVVPAGLKKTFNVASGSTVLTYSATDVAQSVVDLTTGVAVTAATSYTEAEVTAALKERGLIRATERAVDFVSKPIGVAPYDMWQAPGSDHWNPANLTKHNFRPQGNVTVLTDYVIAVPLLPAKATTETMDGDLANLAGSIDWSSSRTGGWFGSTALHGLVKYASSVAAGDDVVGYVSEKWPMAHNTAETPIASDATNGLVREVDSVSAISAAGDWFMDYDLGILFLYEADGNAIPSPFTTSSTLTYYHYEDEETASSSRTSSYVCATGNLEFGDFVSFNEDSNFVVASLDISAAEGYDSTGSVYSADPSYDSGDDAAISLQIENAVKGWQQGIVGQVVGTVDYPRSGLDRVRSEYQGQTTVTYQTPGTATGGRTDQLTYAGAGEKMVLINLIMR